MIIAWHLLSGPQARYRDPGPDWHARRTSRDKKIRTRIQALKALGVTVAITDDEQQQQRPPDPHNPNRNALTGPEPPTAAGSASARPHTCDDIPPASRRRCRAAGQAGSRVRHRQAGPLPRA